MPSNSFILFHQKLQPAEAATAAASQPAEAAAATSQPGNPSRRRQPAQSAASQPSRRPSQPGSRPGQAGIQVVSQGQAGGQAAQSIQPKLPATQTDSRSRCQPARQLKLLLLPPASQWKPPPPPASQATEGAAASKPSQRSHLASQVVGQARQAFRQSVKAKQVGRLLSPGSKAGHSAQTIQSQQAAQARQAA